MIKPKTPREIEIRDQARADGIDEACEWCAEIVGYSIREIKKLNGRLVEVDDVLLLLGRFSEKFREPLNEK